MNGGIDFMDLWTMPIDEATEILDASFVVLKRKEKANEQ